MRRMAVLIVSLVINASSIPALASECTANKGIHASCEHGERASSQPVGATDIEKTCRGYAASFYQSAMLRQAAASRGDSARMLVALDSVTNAFNDLLATRCGG